MAALADKLAAARAASKEVVRPYQAMEPVELGTVCCRAMGTPRAVCAWTDEAMGAVKGLLEGDGRFAVYLGQDIKAETVTLLGTSRDAVQLPSSELAFSFVRLDDNRIVYVYSCPEGAPVRAKMFASSTTNGIVYNAEHRLGVSVVMKVRPPSRGPADNRSCRRTSRHR